MAWVVASGCSKAADDPRAACTPAVARGIARTVEKRRAAIGDHGDASRLDAVAASVEAAVVELCVADRWPKQVVACFSHEPDLARCHDLFTPEQRARYTRETMKLALATKLGAGAPDRTPRRRGAKKQ